ncbi:cytochrome P450 [Streptomyces sp. NPDC007088]|uniref:cytochrome P450 n=1 Tax=Streptomyces sp. NPDC007088 TaxID=3364773 RepID=UPI0036C48C95
MLCLPEECRPRGRERTGPRAAAPYNRAAAPARVRRAVPLALALARDPLPYYRLLRTAPGPVPLPGRGVWLAGRYADVAAALAEPRLVARGHGAAAGNLRCAGDLSGLGEAVARAAYVLVRRLERRAEADLVTEFCDWLPAVTLVSALGLPPAETARLQRWCRGGTRGHDGLAEYLGPHLRRTARHAGLAPLSRLTGAGPLADREPAVLLGALLRAAGADTARGLASLLAALLDHPAQLLAVREDPGLLPAAWAESRRRDPPSPLLPLTVTGALPVRLPGGEIPAGATVLCLLGAAGRDPRRFADPDRFDLFRPDAAPVRPAPASGTDADGLGLLQARHGLPPLLAHLPGLNVAPGFRPRPVGLAHRAPRRLLVRTHARPVGAPGGRPVSPPAPPARSGP